MTDKNTSPLEDQCPLCKGPNHCGMAQGHGTCWCFSSGKVSEKALAELDTRGVHQICLCEYCAKDQKSPHARAQELKNISQKR